MKMPCAGSSRTSSGSGFLNETVGFSASAKDESTVDMLCEVDTLSISMQLVLEPTLPALQGDNKISNAPESCILLRPRLRTSGIIIKQVLARWSNELV